MKSLKIIGPIGSEIKTQKSTELQMVDVSKQNAVVTAQ